MTGHRRSITLTAVGVVAALGLAACGGGGTASKTKTVGAATSPTTAAASDATSNSYALSYTGGTAGKADPTKPKIFVGYVNEEGAVPAFPEASAGIDAAVKYINNELGGVQGHPLELKKCVVQTEEDGQKCGTQFANDNDVKFVLTGVLVLGAKSLYSVLSGKKPVIIGNPVVPEDF